MNENNLSNQNNNQSEQNMNNNQFETTNNYNENFQQSNNKTNKKRLFIIVIICILLSIVVIKAIMYFIDEKNNKPIDTNSNINVDIDEEKEDNKPTEEIKDEEEIYDENNETNDSNNQEYNYNEIVELLEKYEGNFCSDYNIFADKFSINNESYIINTAIAYSNNENLIKIDYEKISDSKIKDFLKNQMITEAIPSSEILKTAKQMFGNNVKFKNQSVYGFYYINEYDAYGGGGPASGCGAGVPIDYKINKIDKTNGLTVYVTMTTTNDIDLDDVYKTYVYDFVYKFNKNGSDYYLASIDRKKISEK